MSWREQSTFKPTSNLEEVEKEFLKQAKKVREILKLEAKIAQGEKLQDNQQQKVLDKDKIVKDIAVLVGKLPGTTDLLEKNPDVAQLLPDSVQNAFEKRRYQEQEKALQDQQRRERREAKEQEERSRPQFMTRHDRPILDIAVSPEDGFIYTCSKDKFVLCWSSENSLLTCKCTYAGHNGAVWAIDVQSRGPAAAIAGAAADQRWLLSGAADSKVMLWRTDTPRTKPFSVVGPTLTIDHGGIVRSLRWCPFDEPGSSSQRFASASEKLGKRPAAIAVWSFDGRSNPTELFRLEDLPGKANDLRWAGGAKLKLLSAHDNGYVGVWLAEAPGRLLKTIKLHGKPVASLAITSDAKSLVTASHDATVKVVDISTQETETLATYKADRPLNAVDVSTDYVPSGGTYSGAIVVGGGRDPMIVTTSSLMEDEFEAKVLDPESGCPIAAGKGHFGPVHKVVSMPWLGPRGAFATCSEDGCLRVHGLDGTLLCSDKIE